MILLLWFVASAFVFAQLVQTYAPPRPILAVAPIQRPRVALVWGG